jgi:very-short-patch-repair endonuclease
MCSGLKTLTPSPRGGEGRDEGSSGKNTNHSAKVRSARSLRRNQTKAEAVFWNAVRDRRLGNFKFTRQFAIGRYTVDFVCRLRRVIVEIDGGQHGVKKKQDDQRTAVLETHRYLVIRFWNNEVIENLEGVLVKLLSFLDDGSSPADPPLIPTFSPSGRRGKSKSP